MMKWNKQVLCTALVLKYWGSMDLVDFQIRGSAISLSANTMDCFNDIDFVSQEIFDPEDDIVTILGIDQLKGFNYLRSSLMQLQVSIEDTNGIVYFHLPMGEGYIKKSLLGKLSETAPNRYYVASQNGTINVKGFREKILSLIPIPDHHHLNLNQLKRYFHLLITFQSSNPNNQQVCLNRL